MNAALHRISLCDGVCRCKSADEAELLELLHIEHSGTGVACARVAALLTRQQASSYTRFTCSSNLHRGGSFNVFTTCFACAKAAVEAGFPVDARNALGRTPLLCVAACRYPPRDRLRMAQFLIAQGAQVDAVDAKNVPPLVYAAGSGKAGIVQALIAAGAQPDCAVCVGVQGPLLPLAYFAAQPCFWRTTGVIQNAIELNEVLAAWHADATCYFSIVQKRAVFELIALCIWFDPALPEEEGGLPARGSRWQSTISKVHPPLPSVWELLWRE
jgi:hypothetical protein